MCLCVCVGGLSGVCVCLFAWFCVGHILCQGRTLSTEQVIVPGTVSVK